ncbi:unnamed protein product [Gordionus sp. m RMFG-2023]|uniref:RNA 3'-terminal phosphate cyclase-like protein n=1 Tax=Gordionus sp. m RMFG-2023 TaxID=3053472 RepID=UPI0030E2D96B
MGKKEILKYEGSSYFRQRIVLATLTNQPIKIKNINAKDLNPGIKDYHISFIRILDEISNGCIIEFNETGTELFYKPGLLTGGAFEHSCNEQKSIGYYLEGLICLAPYVKNPIKARLTGVTNDNSDPSVDSIKYSTLPLFVKFLHLEESALSSELDIKIVKRCLPTNQAGNKMGEIIFTCPVYNVNPVTNKAIDLWPSTSSDANGCSEIDDEEGNDNLEISDALKDYQITKVRGVAYTLKVSPNITTRLITESQKILKAIGCTNAYIRTDNYKKSQCGYSPGFGLCLYAQTQNGCTYFSEHCSYRDGENSKLITPEELALRVTYKLLDEIYMGGSTDSSNQWLAFLLMSLTNHKVSRILTSRLTAFSRNTLKLIEDVIGVKFKIDRLGNKNHDEMEREGDKEVKVLNYVVTCLGAGFDNINKALR